MRYFIVYSRVSGEPVGACRLLTRDHYEVWNHCFDHAQYNHREITETEYKTHTEAFRTVQERYHTDFCSYDAWCALVTDIRG